MTRLEQLESGGFDATVMAAAAIDRLALDLSTPVDRLHPSIMLPQVAQGALAIECRADDTETIAVLRAIQHADTRRVDTEAFSTNSAATAISRRCTRNCWTTASRSPACWRRLMPGPDPQRSSVPIRIGRPAVARFRSTSGEQHLLPISAGAGRRRR